MQKPSKTGTPGAETLWDDLQYLHIFPNVDMHGAAFLPYHRFFVTVHEKLIRSECGYTEPLP
jgi:tyrosinase